MAEQRNLRVNVSMRTSILAKARALMKVRDFPDLSGFLAQLIREEHERRAGPAILQDAPPDPEPEPTAAPQPPAQPVTYKAKRPRR